MSPENQNLIEMQALQKFFMEGERRHTILDNVTTNIRRGEIVILLGRSGSGKSTLLNLLSGIDLPSGGNILIDGKDLGALSERNRTLFRRQNIGFIFQFFNLIPTLSVEDNLRLPLELNGIAEHNQINDLLQEVQLQNRRSSYPDVLSGGEQQRVAMARAIIHDPPIILADEPTGNLDFETGKTVIELLDMLVRKHSKTMIMATHSRELIGIADRIITIKDKHLLHVQEVSSL
ncbi:MAG: ATP-binding cassette domain-containing protein [Caldithrix sp.]|nr:ATP-binding cassette domain-containing protein [Caldithrix sp.]